MTDGWTGSSVLCSLGDGAVERFDRPDFRRDFLGGRGYGVALMAQFGFPARPVLEPAQPFVLSAGPLTGTTAPSSGRFAAVGLSPLTGTLFDGNAGGRFGVRLRQAGLDALVLVGCSPEWSVVVIDGCRGRGTPSSVRVVPLRELWPEIDPLDVGLTSSRTVEGLRGRLGAGFSLVFPSVAGRRGAFLGSLRTDDRRNLGRGGLGAALSAKRVFAVAVAGDREIDVADPGRFKFLVYEAEKQLAANPVTSRALPEFGTAVLMQIVHQAGALPALNYRTAAWGGVDSICGEAVRDQMTRGKQGCFGCHIRCTRRVETGEGPEYETLWAFGAACGVTDLATIQEANRLCAEFGLDTISLGATIACAMELGEAGALGRALRFGDGVRLLEVVLEAAEGRGFGAELADGSARFAACYGHPELAMHVKGLELPAYDPRGMHGQGLAYATSNRGACHLRGNMLGPELLGIPKLIDRFLDRGKSGILVTLQHQAAVFDSACLCKFAGFAFGDDLLSRMLTAATGESISERHAQAIGERIWNLERLWNVAAGFSGRDDTLPRRILDEPHSEGPSAGRVIDLPAMLDEYYRARGWTTDGVPSAAKVHMLGLDGQAALLRSGPAGDGMDTAGAGQGWRLEVAAAAGGRVSEGPHGGSALRGRGAIYEQCRDVGRDCFVSGLVSSHAGNMSVRIGDRLVITRRGSMLGRLRPEDLIETGIDRDDSGIALASSEIMTHRAIYAHTAAQAILHTHPPHGVVLSLAQDEIIPIDSEGSYLFRRVPVVAAERTVGSREMAEAISARLGECTLCMLRGHGLFATGHLLEEAYQLSSAFEASARIIYLTRLAGITPIEFRRDSDKYGEW